MMIRVALAFAGVLLLAACGREPDGVTDAQVGTYQANMEAACRKKVDADSRVQAGAAAPYCACVMSAYRKDVTPAEWRDAHGYAAAGRNADELKVFEKHQKHLEACAQQVLKPAAKS